MEFEQNRKRKFFEILDEIVHPTKQDFLDQQLNDYDLRLLVENVPMRIKLKLNCVNRRLRHLITNEIPPKFLIVEVYL
jgi:hypothetical protein